MKMPEGLDALDALLLFGFRIVKEMPKTSTLITGTGYRLCGSKVDGLYPDSVSLLFKEVDEAPEFYKKRLVQMGKRMK
jgi:hypothetical protein